MLRILTIHIRCADPGGSKNGNMSCYSQAINVTDPYNTYRCADPVGCKNGCNYVMLNTSNKCYGSLQYTLDVRIQEAAKMVVNMSCYSQAINVTDPYNIDVRIQEAVKMVVNMSC